MRHKRTKEKVNCYVENCARLGKYWHEDKKYCRKHHKHLVRRGEILKRAKNDLNEIVKYDTYAELFVYKIDYSIACKIKIDLEDVERVKNYHWHYRVNRKDNTSKIYVYNKKIGKIHNFIMNFIPSDTHFIDHLSNDELDCRKINLRKVDRTYNASNSKLSKANKSGYKGVAWDKRLEKWYSHIGYKNNKIRLGYFSNIEDAIAAREKAEDKYFGEYSYRASQEKAKEFAING